ncbi:hypothetical protein M1D55_09990 [Cupriavidus sp. JZ107]
MITSRIIRGALAVIVAATSAVAVAAPATSSKVGKFDVYADALRAGKFNTFTDGARQGKFDTFSEGARQGKFDPYSEGTRQGQFDSFSEGARAPSGEIAASSLDNARSGDGSLYGYRV